MYRWCLQLASSQVMIIVQFSVVERAFSSNLRTVPTSGRLSTYSFYLFNYSGHMTSSIFQLIMLQKSLQCLHLFDDVTKANDV